MILSISPQLKVVTRLLPLTARVRMVVTILVVADIIIKVGSRPEL